MKIKSTRAKLFPIFTLLVFSDVFGVQAACLDVTADVFVASAIDYYLRQGQPTGSIKFLDNGKTIETYFKPFVDLADFKSLNLDCCKIMGLTDSDGQIFSRFEILYYDIHSTILIKTFVRQIDGDHEVIVKDAPDRLPMNSCAEVIIPLVGE